MRVGAKVTCLIRSLAYRTSCRQLSRHQSSLVDILRLVEAGKMSVEDAASNMTALTSQTLATAATRPPSPDETLDSFANLDHSRTNRAGFPEAVFAEGKTATQVAKILDDMAFNVNQQILQTSENKSYYNTASTAILATRVTPEQFEAVAKIPLFHGTIKYHETARIISMHASGVESNRRLDPPTKIVIACAGTTDLPVAEEAAVTLESAGCEITRVYDVGVAGLHRIIQALPKLRDPQVRCVIVCAGMDGALPSVVGGLVSVPVIAVPTSIGYGASFGGVSALLTMLNSCSPGVAVVNIDNGFGAAALAFKCAYRK